MKLEQSVESEDKACERGRTVMVRNEVKKEQEGRTSGVNVSWRNSHWEEDLRSARYRIFNASAVARAAHN